MEILRVADTDTFGNFVGFDSKIPGGAGAVHVVSGPGGNVLIVAPDGSYYSAAYTGVGADGSTLEGLNDLGAAQAGNATSITNADIPAGSVIYQANSAGTPIGYALAMGKTALYYAKGGVFNEQIYHYDDFANSGNDAHLSAIGIQSVYGMAVYQDTNGRIPGVQLIEAVRQIPGFSF